MIFWLRCDAILAPWNTIMVLLGNIYGSIRIIVCMILVGPLYVKCHSMIFIITIGIEL